MSIQENGKERRYFATDTHNDDDVDWEVSIGEY